MDIAEGPAEGVRGEIVRLGRVWTERNAGTGPDPRGGEGQNEGVSLRPGRVIYGNVKCRNISRLTTSKLPC